MIFEAAPHLVQTVRQDGTIQFSTRAPTAGTDPAIVQTSAPNAEIIETPNGTRDARHQQGIRTDGLAADIALLNNPNLFRQIYLGRVDQEAAPQHQLTASGSGDPGDDGNGGDRDRDLGRGSRGRGPSGLGTMGNPSTTAPHLDNSSLIQALSVLRSTWKEPKAAVPMYSDKIHFDDWHKLMNSYFAFWKVPEEWKTRKAWERSSATKTTIGSA